jgi:hypothetical protein
MFVFRMLPKLIASYTGPVILPFSLCRVSLAGILIRPFDQTRYKTFKYKETTLVVWTSFLLCAESSFSRLAY